jgi:hypothetical protein
MKNREANEKWINQNSKEISEKRHESNLNRTFCFGSIGKGKKK